MFNKVQDIGYYEAEIIKVHTSNKIKLRLTLLEGLIHTGSYEFYGIRCHSNNSKNIDKRVSGQMAFNFIKKIEGKKCIVKFTKNKVELFIKGVNLNEQLFEKCLASPYFKKNDDDFVEKILKNNT